MYCKDIEPVVGCWLKADGSTESVVIHYTYGMNAAGVEIIASTRYTTADGTPVALAVGETVTPGVCSPNFAISHTEAGCANGVPWTRRTTLVRNAANDIVATLVSYIDSSGAATAAFPAGFQLGACPLIPVQTTEVIEVTAGSDVGIGAKAISAVLVWQDSVPVPTGSQGIYGHGGSGGVVKVPIGFSVGVDADDQGTLDNGLFFETGTAGAVWVVTVKWG